MKSHCKSNTKLYRIWTSMKRRLSCNGSEHDKKSYKNISMCEEWKDMYSFFMWAEPVYKEGMELDRINNLGNYEPNNCRFTTRKLNNQNTRKSKYWYIQGKRFNSSSDAAEFHNLDQSMVVKMCNGYTCNGKYYPPISGCYSEFKYANNH